MENSDGNINKMQGPLCSIETMNFKSRSNHLNSPRSIEACFRLGIQPSELYYISFDKYKTKNQDIINLPIDLQQYRYKHYEEFRLKTIQQIKDERNVIIQENEASKSLNKSKENNNSRDYSTIERRFESLIEEEKKMIEKIKHRQKLEIQSLIETQVKTELLRQVSLSKDKRLKEKEEYRKMEGLKKMKEMEEMRRVKELKRQGEMNRIAEEQRQKIMEKNEKELKRLNELKEIEKIRKEEMQRKTIEEQIKIANNKGQLQHYYKLQEERINQKRILLEEKTKEQQRVIESRRNERIRAHEINRSQAEKRLLNNRSQSVINLTKMRDQIEEKHHNNDKKLEEYYTQRNISIKEQQVKSEKKKQEIMLMIKRTEELTMIKQIQYNEKKTKMEHALMISELTRNAKVMHLSQIIQDNHDKTLENRRQLSKEKEKRQHELLEKMETIDQRIIEQKKKEEREIMEKQEESKTKSYEKTQQIERVKRIKEYRNKIRMDELEEKEKKLEEYNQQKIKMLSMKAQMSSDIQKEKKAIVTKFDRILKNKQQINSDLVKELFPNDNGLYIRIKQLEGDIEQKSGIGVVTIKSRSTSALQKRQPSACNKKSDLTVSNPNEKEIEKKVEEFRICLREVLNKVLKEEQENERQRVKLYESLTDLNDKQIQEKLNAKARAESNMKVLTMQNEIEKKTKVYEDRLRQDYQSSS